MMKNWLKIGILLTLLCIITIAESTPKETVSNQITINLLLHNHAIDYCKTNNNVSSLRSLQNKKIISLGNACAPALHLRTLGIRTEAYPFDWIISHFDALYEALTSNFTYFLTDIKLRKDGTGVYDYYNFQFVHDFPTINTPKPNVLNSDFIGASTLLSNWQDALSLVKEKYNRRINRFYTACQGKEQIFFFRDEDTTREQAMKLRDYFTTTYPNLNFLLVITSKDESFHQPWDLDKIRNFYMSAYNDTKRFKEILTEVGIIL